MYFLSDAWIEHTVWRAVKVARLVKSRYSILCVLAVEKGIPHLEPKRREVECSTRKRFQDCPDFQGLPERWLYRSSGFLKVRDLWSYYSLLSFVVYYWHTLIPANETRDVETRRIN